MTFYDCLQQTMKIEKLTCCNQIYHVKFQYYHYWKFQSCHFTGAKEAQCKHANIVIFITGGSHVIGRNETGRKDFFISPIALHPLRFRVTHSSSSAYINLIFMLQSFKPAIECSKCLYSIWASSLPNYLWHVGLLQILQLLSPLTLLQILLRLWSGNTIYI